MSYKLFFKQKEDQQPFTLSLFQEYFKTRMHYSVKKETAIYKNKETGVDFEFKFYDQPDQAASINEKYISSFNLNYFRPHIFALEAESEVKNFAKRFAQKNFNPQTKDDDQSNYSLDNFIDDWNYGNELSYKENLSKEEKKIKPHTLDTGTIEQVWHWNYNRGELQQKVGESSFVPLIVYLQVDKKNILLGCTWKDGVPVILPEVDIVLIERKRLTPDLFKKHGAVPVPFSWLSIITSNYKKVEDHFPYYNLNYTEATKAVQQFLKNIKPGKANYTIIEPKNILNQEIVELIAEIDA